MKLTRLVVGDVELTKRQYWYHNATASTPRTTSTANIIISATKAKTTTINCAATTMTTGATAIAAKAKGIKAKILGNIEIVLKKFETHCAQRGCQEDVSAMLQKRSMALS